MTDDETKVKIVEQTLNEYLALHTRRDLDVIAKEKGLAPRSYPNKKKLAIAILALDNPDLNPAGSPKLPKGNKVKCIVLINTIELDGELYEKGEVMEVDRGYYLRNTRALQIIQ